MTLYKQLALLLSLLLLVILSTVSVLKFNASITETKQQLFRNAENTAASLSLSLASAKGDEAILSTMINANFDTGHYRAIILENMQDDVIFERLVSVCSPAVPTWFSNVINIDVPAASAQVSSGWMVIGTLTVESDAAPSYVYLYNSFLNLLYLFGLFMLLSLLLLYVLLYTLLKPLRNLREQAEAISRNEFRYQEQLPYTTEFKEIVLSMNTLVKKIETNFKANAKVVQQNHRLLYTEKLPKLYNEHYLMLKCNEECMENSEFDGGVIIVMELIVNAKSIKAEQQEDLFISLASIMIEKSAVVVHRIVAKIDNNRLTLLMPGTGELQACKVKQEVTETFISFLEAQNIDKETMLINQGMYHFNAHEKCQDFIEKARKQLSEKSRNICKDEEQSLRNKEQLTQEDWSYLIMTALRSESFSYEVRNVIDTSDKAIYDRGITIIMKDNSGTIYPYGRFIAAAVKAHKVLDIYMQVIRVLVQNFSSNDKKGRYTFSFANTLLLEEHTFGILEKEFRNFENTHNLDFCIELPENFIVEHAGEAKRYVALIKEHGYRFGIGEFSAESESLDYLNILKPEFIKISKLFLLDLIYQSSPLLSSLQMATDALGIKIIATGVSSVDELAIINEAGVTIVQGFITEII